VSAVAGPGAVDLLERFVALILPRDGRALQDVSD